MRTTTAKTLSLAAISLLLITGCHGKEELPAIPDPTTANASTTASASADATENTESTGKATDSTEATAEATASETQNYSGDSKAPEGEYRPADEHGPAQNVPKPVEPEGMNVESEDGLFKFLGYWNQSVNYGIETGDFSKAEPLISADYTNEQNTYAILGEIYNRGGWVVGGRREISLGENNLFAKGQGEYSWLGYLSVEDMQTHLEGPGNIVDNSQTRNKAVYFEIKYTSNKWEVKNITVAEITE